MSVNPSYNKLPAALPCSALPVCLLSTGFNAQAVKAAVQRLGRDCYELQHGVSHDLLPPLNAPSAFKAAAETAAAIAAGDEDDSMHPAHAVVMGWTSVDCFRIASTVHARATNYCVRLLMRTAAEEGFRR